MRKITGLVLAVAALGTAGYFGVAYDRDKAAQKRLTELVRIAAEGSRPANRQTVDATRAGEAAKEAPQAPAVAEILAARESAGNPSSASEVAAPPIPRSFATARPKDEAARRDLALSIQAELKRVGCFDGEIDGIWSSATRRGMQSFTDRVNASLPTNEPDYILLTLLQGHAAKACGKDCPSGQSLSFDGRCYPRAIVATQSRETPVRSQGDRKSAAGGEVPPRAEARIDTQRIEGARTAVGSETSAARVGEDVRLREGLVELQRTEAEKLRASRVEVEQLKGKAADEARQRQVELERLKAAAKAEAEQQRLARLEADRAAKAQAAEDTRRRKQTELEAKQAARDETARLRTAALEAAAQARQASATSTPAARATSSAEAVVASVAADRLSDAMISEAKLGPISSAAVAAVGTGIASKVAGTGQWIEKPAASDAASAKSASKPVVKKKHVASDDADERSARRAKYRSESPPPPRVVRWGPPPEPWPMVPRYIQRFSPPYLLGGPYFVPRPVWRSNPRNAASRAAAFHNLSRRAP